RALGPDHPRTYSAMASRAMALQDLGEWTEAESLARRAADGLRKNQERRLSGTGRAIRVLASILQERERSAEAEPLYREAITSLRVTLAKCDWQINDAVRHCG